MTETIQPIQSLTRWKTRIPHIPQVIHLEPSQFLSVSSDKIVVHNHDVWEVYLRVVFNVNITEKSFSGWETLIGEVILSKPCLVCSEQRLLERTLDDPNKG